MIGRLSWLLLLLPAAAAAQVPTPRPVQRPVQADTVPRDTVAWIEPDSVMASLLTRPGYSVTRYEGAVVTFDAVNAAFAIAADATQRAQVQRDEQLVTTDSTIIYRDKVDSVQVTGRFRIRPGQGQPPIAGSGTAAYSLLEREGVLTNASVIVEEAGDRWFINAHVGKTALGDTAAGVPTRFYGRGGSLTSCEDSLPHYHFRLREIKRTDRTLVARPSVMYVEDIPVLWLPFVFQDIRPGRRSGVLPPRFGASDIVRNNPGYRRHVENIGYYWAFSDYADATVWADWRSGAGGNEGDPGWYKLNAEWRYSWLSRFLQGRLASSYQEQNSGDNNLAVSWGHQQRFGRHRNLSANVNYVTSTQLQRQNTFNPVQAMATIRSSFTLTDKVGPASLSLGGSRTQFPGRETIEQSFPSFSVNTSPLEVASWLVWTPRFTYSDAATLHIDQPSTFMTRTVPGTGGAVLDTLDRNQYSRTISIGSPLRVAGIDFSNDLQISDRRLDFPELKTFYVDADSARREQRVFAETYKTTVDWNPGFALPALFQNRYKVTPSISLQNVADGPFWIRSDLSGGRWVSQSKRLVYGVSAAPTIFGLWPGFGPFTRLRHAVSPTLSFNYAPRAEVPREYLAAQGQFRGSLEGLAQKSVSLGLSQNIEAKVEGPLLDSATSGGAQKLKLLSMQFTPLTYNFERARVIGRSLAGLVTENLGFRATSDLLPGFDLSVDYSLFQGSTQSDTARFDPYLTRIASTFRISQRENPLTVISRLWGRAVPQRDPDPLVPGRQTQEEAALTRELSVQPVAGQAARGAQLVVPPTRGWEATLSFSTTRTRPPVGGNVINFDPRIRCEPLREINQFAYDQCFNAPINEEAIQPTTGGASFLLIPPRTSLSGSMNFELTPKWAAAWQTSYDFEQQQFAQHTVSLQRDMHDFRSVFAFTKSPNGNFAFNFFIALKPQPDLKFDYSRATVRTSQ